MDVCDSTPAKICTKCNLAKPPSDFHKSNFQKCGLAPSCKECRKAASSAYRAANPEKCREYALAWAAANPEKKKELKAAWRAANPEKQKAESAAYRLKCPEKLKAADLRRYRSDPEGQKARVAAYREANPEKISAYAASYRATQPDAVKEARDKWRAANPAKVRAMLAQWKAKNPEANRIAVSNRRARRKKNGGMLSTGLAEKLFALQKGLCPCCKQPLGKSNHLDHILPLALGGTNTDDNMQLLRAICNQQKHAKHPIDFMQSRGFLL